MRALIVLGDLRLFAGCATVPKVDDTPTGPAATPIVGARGPLTVQQSKALLDRIAPEPGDAGMLKRHLAIEQAVAETPLVAGNATRLLIDGEQTFAAMFAAIKSAKATINLEYYIFEDVQSGGQHLGDLLIAKHQQGVAINVIYDSYGSSATPAGFLQAPEGRRHPCRRVQSGQSAQSVPLNNRDHRKILVVGWRHGHCRRHQSQRHL